MTGAGGGGIQRAIRLETAPRLAPKRLTSLAWKQCVTLVRAWSSCHCRAVGETRTESAHDGASVHAAAGQSRISTLDPVGTTVGLLQRIVTGESTPPVKLTPVSAEGIGSI